jgi:hypothetical protein
MALIDLAQEDEPDPIIGVGEEIAVGVRTCPDGQRRIVVTMFTPTALGFPIVVLRTFEVEEVQGLQIAMGRLLRRLT